MHPARTLNSHEDTKAEDLSVLPYEKVFGSKREHWIGAAQRVNARRVLASRKRTRQHPFTKPANLELVELSDVLSNQLRMRAGHRAYAVALEFSKHVKTVGLSHELQIAIAGWGYVARILPTPLTSRLDDAIVLRETSQNTTTDTCRDLADPALNRRRRCA